MTLIQWRRRLPVLFKVTPMENPNLLARGGQLVNTNT